MEDEVLVGIYLSCQYISGTTLEGADYFHDNYPVTLFPQNVTHCLLFKQERPWFAPSS